MLYSLCYVLFVCVSILKISSHLVLCLEHRKTTLWVTGDLKYFALGCPQVDIAWCCIMTSFPSPKDQFYYRHDGCKHHGDNRIITSLPVCNKTRETVWSTFINQAKKHNLNFTQTFKNLSNKTVRLQKVDVSVKIVYIYI